MTDPLDPDLLPQILAGQSRIERSLAAMQSQLAAQDRRFDLVSDRLLSIDALIRQFNDGRLAILSDNIRLIEAAILQLNEHFGVRNAPRPREFKDV